MTERDRCVMGEFVSSIGPFELRGQLGRGAMAVVWRGYDRTLEREVAIKEPLLLPGTTQTGANEFAERFVREAKAAARINHPGVVTIYSAAVYDGRPVIVMELIEGPTLRAVLKHSEPTASQTFALLDQLMDAVGHAHHMGIVHRDLKPENVFVLPDGRIKLADFGVAHMRGDVMLTQAGTVLGTPAYMSPEQIRGNTTDARSDVFSLGVVAYEALSGENPFGGDSAIHITTVMHRIVNEPVPPLRLDGSSLAGPLAAVVLRALEKDPGERYATATEMRDAWRAAFAKPLDCKREVSALLSMLSVDVRTGLENQSASDTDEGTVVDVEESSAPAVATRAAVSSAVLASSHTLPVGRMPSEGMPAEQTTEVTEESSSVPEQPIAVVADSDPEVPASPAAKAAVSEVGAGAPPTVGSEDVPRRRARRAIALVALLAIVAAAAFAAAPLVGGEEEQAQEEGVAPSASAEATTSQAVAEPMPVPEPEPEPLETALSIDRSADRVKKGSTITISGRLSSHDAPLKDYPVRIQRSYDKDKWRTVAEMDTSLKGVVSKKIEMDRTAYYRLRFLGNDEYLKSTSKVVKVEVYVPAVKTPQPAPTQPEPLAKPEAPTQPTQPPPPPVGPSD